MEAHDFSTQIKDFFKSKSTLSILISICVGVWLVIALFGMITYLFQLPFSLNKTVTPWLALSSNPMTVLTHPWTLVSYMFLHSGFWHLLWNMVMLLCAGTMVVQVMGERRMLSIFLWSGVAGGALMVLCYNLFPVFRTHAAILVGCSGGALGLFFAAAAQNPNQRVSIWPFRMLQIPMIWLAVIFLLLDLMSLSRGNTGGHIAHIGGSVCGYLMVWCQQHQTFQGLKQWFANLKPKPRQKRTKMDAQQGGRPLSDDEWNRRRKAEQDKVDHILDKISANGYASLTKEEKDFLFNYKAKKD